MSDRRLVGIFSFNGRSSRLAYGLTVGGLLGFELLFVLWLETGAPEGIRYTLWLFPLMALFMAPIVAIMAAAARRLHDTDRSALWLCMALAVAKITASTLGFLGFDGWAEEAGLGVIAALLLYLGFARGSPGENDFGPAEQTL